MTAWKGFIRIAAVLACSLFPALAPTPADAEELSAIARGGRLYDNWWRELDERPPADRHVSYPIGSSAANDAPRSWRCVECHGFDYRGGAGQSGKGERYTGIKGITGFAGSEPAKVLAVLRDRNHRYGEVMDNQDLDDLALFVARGQSPLMARLDETTGRVTADPKPAAPIYLTVCASCHGVDGQAMANIPPLGDLARNDAWQTLHNILNGHAGGSMPSLRALDDSMILSTLAFLQTLPETSQITSVTRGGRLYANWQKETGRQAPQGLHPAYPAGSAVADERLTWNCRECHGWDYLGKDGAFATGRHHTGIKGIGGMANAEPAKIIAVLTDRTHRYDTLLTPRDLSDLANFVAKGQITMAKVIDKSGKAAGDAEAFASHFQTMCATCHGKDGKRVRTMPPLGRVVTEQPERALHSIVNGHPGEFMPPLRAFPDRMIAGILAYAQGLPTKK
jgi:cytochrome c553